MTSIVTMPTEEEDESTNLLTISVSAEQESAMEAFFQINSWTLIKEDIKDDGMTERLVTLRVTPEQEAAMEAFFQINNWAFIKAVKVSNAELDLQQQQQQHEEEEALEEVGQFQQEEQDQPQETIVEEVQGLQEVQVAATGVNGQPQIITVYTEGSDAQGLPASLLTDNRGEGTGQQSHVIIQEITLPEGMTLDQGLVISNPQPVTRRVVPRGSMKPGDKLHKCHVCGKTFKQLQSFNGHYQSHFGAKPFQCEICNTGFTLKAALVAHHSIHTGSKPFSCTMCPKSFRRKDDMVSHVRTHTGEKPYECDICGKKFKYRNQIPKHRRAHTGEKPYKCQTCGKAFTSNIHLRRHERTHTGERPYKCQMCPKAFTQFGHLQAHMRIHTDERPFTCSICGRGFREKKVMKKHEALHTSERPYKCSECGKGFLRQSNLELHAVMHQKVTDGRPRTRPRPKKKLQADAEMREFVANVLSNVKKVDSGMQTDNVVQGVPTGESKATDNLAAFVDFAVEQESSQSMKVEPIGDLQHIAGNGQYTLVMQDDGSEGYLITNYDPNAVTGEIVTIPSQQVEISSEYSEGQTVTDYNQGQATSITEQVVDSGVLDQQTAEIVVEGLANVVSAAKTVAHVAGIDQSQKVMAEGNILDSGESAPNLLSLNAVDSLSHVHQQQVTGVSLLQSANNLDGSSAVANLSGDHPVSQLTNAISHSGNGSDVLQSSEVEQTVVKPIPCNI